MELIIDGSKIMSETDFHQAVAEGLALPSWYGKNLDALWDTLTGMVERPLKIIWIHTNQSKKRLSRYEKIISLLKEVEEKDKEIKKDKFFTFEIR